MRGQATHWTKPASDGHGGILIEDGVQSDAASNANTGARAGPPKYLWVFDQKPPYGEGHERRDGPMLLQNSFWGVEQKFLKPLMRGARGHVRDHIDGSEINLGSP
jgi:hypothetical protein